MGATESDFMALQSVRRSTRVEVMYVYLCDKHCYSMQEVAEKVLHDNQSQAGKRVSSIMRCYGFNGKGNAGKYADVAVRDDIEEFVRRYPNGAADGAFEQFIRPRIKQRQEAAAQRQRDQQREQAERWQREQAAKRRAMEQEAERKRLAIEQEAERKRQQQEYEERLRRAQEAERRRQEEAERKQKILRENQIKFRQKWDRAKLLGEQGAGNEADALFQSLLNMTDEEAGGEMFFHRKKLVDDYGNFLFHWGLREKNLAKKMEIYKKVPSNSYSYSAAVNNVGVIFSNPSFAGHDLQTAEKWFRVAADRGCDDGAKNLASLLKDKDPKQALFYYRRSCRDPEIAAQVSGTIEALERQLKDGELPGVSQFLQEHPEWFQVSKGNYDSWQTYAEVNHLSLERMWKKYQETNSLVYEQQRFLFFKKKVYQYQGDLELEDFVGACEKEWKRRSEMFGTEVYICSDEERALAEKSHELGMQCWREGRYEEALIPLCLSASSGNAEARETLFTLCTEKLADKKKARALAMARADVDSCIYLLRSILSGDLEGEMGAAWEALKWLEKGGDELRQREPELCHSVEEVCAKTALELSQKEPVRALSLLERAGIRAGKEYGEVCYGAAEYYRATDQKKTLHYLKEASDQGHAGAIIIYATCLLMGAEAEDSKADGLKLLTDLAERGDKNAALNLGDLYYKGEDVEADCEKAVYYYEKTENPEQIEDYPKAVYRLAKRKREAGELEEAFRCYTIAARSGISGAQNWLAIMYMNGSGTEKNEEEGEKWYRIAAENQNFSAAWNLGRFYLGQGKLEEAKRFLEQAKAGQKDVDQELLEVERLLEKQQKLAQCKAAFEECFARRDYDGAITYLEQIHGEWPEDEIYSERLISCLEESDADMYEWEKHNELARRYINEGENALAWEHYKVSRKLKIEEDIFASLRDIDPGNYNLEDNVSKWRLDFMKLSLGESLSRATYEGIFDSCCRLEDLLEYDAYGAISQVQVMLQLYRIYLELRTDLAWKYQNYEDAAKWLVQRYVVKGRGYHYPSEAGILAHLENEELKRKIETYSKAWEIYEGFLEQNQLEDPNGDYILAIYLFKRYPFVLGGKDFIELPGFENEFMESKSELECRALTNLLALTKSRPILCSLYRLEHGEPENMPVPMGELNTYVVNCVQDFMTHNWVLKVDDRNLDYYMVGQELKEPDCLIDWFIRDPWRSQYQNGLESFRRDLKNGESSRWSQTIRDNHEDLSDPEYCLDGVLPVELLQSILCEETQKCLETQAYNVAAAILRLINTWPYRQHLDAQEVALSEMLEGTSMHCAKDTAVLADYYWKNREELKSTKKAVAYSEAYIEERSGVWGQENGCLIDSCMTGTEEECLEEFCLKYDEKLSFRLGQLYLQGEEIGQDADKAKVYFELCGKLAYMRSDMSEWIRICDVVKRAAAGKGTANQTDDGLSADGAKRRGAASGREISTQSDETGPATERPVQDSGSKKPSGGTLTVTDGNLRPLDQLLHKGEKALAIVVDGVDSREKITAKGFTAAMKWAIERECAGNPKGREKLEQIITLKNGKKLPGGLPARFFSPMLSPEEQKEFTIPAASVKQIEGTNLVLLFHYSSELLCEILVNVLKYMGADLDRFQLVIDSEA